MSPRCINFVCVCALSVASPLWASDLTATKTNDTGGTVNLGNSFEWKIEIRNEGTSTVYLLPGDVLLSDHLPWTNIAYGTPAIAGLPGISCSVWGPASTLICSATAPWDISPGEYFGVFLEATPTATGTYVNPTGGVCAVDPDDVVSETNEINNSCSDTVTAAPSTSDLTATKTNDVGGTVALGNSFEWKIVIRNEGTSIVDLSQGDVLLSDHLPWTNIAYGTPAIAGLPGISCSVWGPASTLICSATMPWDIAPGEYFGVFLEATPTATGTYVNPTGGVCAVDPDGVVSESNVLNNSCSDTVTVVEAWALIFVDGFESGSVSAWSSSVP